MFTMFHGFHLVEEYHQWKKEHRSNRNPIGFIQQKYMVKTGLIMGLVGLVLGYLVLIVCGVNGIF